MPMNLSIKRQNENKEGDRFVFEGRNQGIGASDAPERRSIRQDLVRGHCCCHFRSLTDSRSQLQMGFGQYIDSGERAKILGEVAEPARDFNTNMRHQISRGYLPMSFIFNISRSLPCAELTRKREKLGFGMPYDVPAGSRRDRPNIEQTEGKNVPFTCTNDRSNRRAMNRRQEDEKTRARDILMQDCRAETLVERQCGYEPLRLTVESKVFHAHRAP